MVGVLGLEKEARMMSPVTSHTVQLPSGMAAKKGRRESTIERYLPQWQPCGNCRWMSNGTSGHVVMGVWSRCDGSVVTL